MIISTEWNFNRNVARCEWRLANYILAVFKRIVCFSKRFLKVKQDFRTI
jgi:hypothetical protein